MMKLSQKNAAFTAVLVSASMLTAKVCGMVRDILLAGMYGTETVEAIAFSTASRIPLLFFDIALGTAVTSAFIPIYNEFLGKNQRERATDFSNRFMTLILFITTIIAAVGILFSGTVVKIIAGKLGAEQLLLASELVKILFPTIIITGMAYCMVGVLQSDGEFFIPSIISLVSNALLIVYLAVFGTRFGIYGIAVAMLLAWCTQILVQIPSLHRLHYRFRLKNPFGDPSIKRVCVLALPIIISAWVQPINSMININLASGLNDGAAVPALDYANKLYVILVGVFTYTITNLIFPSLSRVAALKDSDRFARIVRKSVQYVVFIIAPIMAGFLILNVPIIRLFYERGAFDAESTDLTSKALFFYSLGMVGFAISEIMNKSFYALQDGKTPMRVSMLSIGINIVLSLIFILGLHTGLEGLAFSASLAANLTGFGLLIILHRRVGQILNRPFFVSMVKIVISVLLMSAGVILTYQYAESAFGGKWLPLFLPAAVGAMLYVALCALLRLQELTDLFQMIKNKVTGGDKLA